ncbi:MAG TPA: amidohydrolase family protein, partial [Candidatus Limnocylindria bacterium]|nr:amidohydrolase family protein [Candidatus Limnocylindria bacterium]
MTGGSSGTVDLIVRGEVLLAADGGRAERAEALAIRDGRVVATGTDAELTALAGARTTVVDARGMAVIPGLHDFHVHLVGLARLRAGIVLDDAPDGGEVGRRIADAAASRPPDAWVTGRGWSEAQLATTTPEALEAATNGRPTFVRSHDGHSAWASAAARAIAGVGPGADDPPGGRIERDPSGAPTGVLRETALELVAVHVPELAGHDLWPHLDATLRDLAALGITGATEAGDYTDDN